MHKGPITWSLLAVILAILEFKVKIDCVNWNSVFPCKILLHTREKCLSEKESYTCPTRYAWQHV